MDPLKTPAQREQTTLTKPSHTSPPPHQWGPAPQLQPPQLNLKDLQVVATDIKDMLSAAISDLRHEVQALSGRLQEIEITAAHHDTGLRHMHQAVDTHTLQLGDMNCHMEDMGNRGRRHNLRVRGLPETVEQDQLQQHSGESV